MDKRIIFEEKYFTTDSGYVYYQIKHHNDSNAKTIVFLPGLSADHRLFEQQMQYFAQDYTVLSWDAPCHGKSRPYQGFSYQDAAEVLKGILDIEGIKRAVFVGQSGGGFVFQTFLKSLHT